MCIFFFIILMGWSETPFQVTESNSRCISVLFLLLPRWLFAENYKDESSLRYLSFSSSKKCRSSPPSAPHRPLRFNYSDTERFTFDRNNIGPRILRELWRDIRNKSQSRISISRHYSRRSRNKKWQTQDPIAYQRFTFDKLALLQYAQNSFFNSTVTCSINMK